MRVWIEISCTVWLENGEKEVVASNSLNMYVVPLDDLKEDHYGKYRVTYTQYLGTKIVLLEIEDTKNIYENIFWPTNLEK